MAGNLLSFSLGVDVSRSRVGENEQGPAKGLRPLV